VASCPISFSLSSCSMSFSLSALNSMPARTEALAAGKLRAAILLTLKLAIARKAGAWQAGYLGECRLPATPSCFLATVGFLLGGSGGGVVVFLGAHASSVLLA